MGTGVKENSRRKRKDPATYDERRKLTKRKYRLKQRNLMHRNDFRKRSLRTLTAAKYDHMLKQARDRDRNFERKLIFTA